jgi:hypothetical protein
VQLGNEADKVSLDGVTGVGGSKGWHL